MRKIIAGLTSVALVVGLAPAQLFAQGTTKPTEVYLNEQLLPTKMPVKRVAGRTLIGFRDYFEATKVKVSWTDKTRQAVAEVPGTTIVIKPDSGQIIVNDKAVALDVAPQVIEGHIYLPVRKLSNILGYTVDFYADANKGVDQVRLSFPQKTEEKKTGVFDAKGQNMMLPKEFKNDQVIGYYMDKDLLTQIYQNKDKLVAQCLNTKTGEVSKAYEGDVPKNFTVGKLLRDNKGLYLELKPAKKEESAFPGIFYGVGLPTTDIITSEIDLERGKVPYYPSEGSVARLDIETDKLVFSQNHQTGYAFDLDSIIGADPQKAKMVKTSNGIYAFLLNGQLSLINPDLEKKDRLIYDNHFDGKNLGAWNNLLYTWGIEGRYIQLGTVNTENYKMMGIEDEIAYSSIAALPEGSTPTLDDSFVTDDKLYVLVHDQQRYYVASYDFATGAKHLSEIKKGLTVSHLIISNDGVKAIGLDGDALTIFSSK